MTSRWPGGSGPPGRNSPWRAEPNPRKGGAPRAERAPAAPTAGGDDAAVPQPEASGELRLYGFNAVQAAFARRPDAVRKVYLAEAMIPRLQPLLKWCAAQRIGYRVVGEDDLRRLAASAHHEGVVADVLREPPAALGTWLEALPAGPQCALWLDGVGNPHNLGAILRSAAHFGVAGVLLSKTSPLALSGAAARVAEGGAEAVPFVRLGRDDNAIAQLRAAGFAGQRQQAGVRVQQVGPVKLVKRRKQLAQCQVAEGAKQGKGARFDTDRSHDVGSFLKLV